MAQLALNFQSGVTVYCLGRGNSKSCSTMKLDAIFQATIKSVLKNKIWDKVVLKKFTAWPTRPCAGTTATM
jgi:hypothetical protein